MASLFVSGAINKIDRLKVSMKRKPLLIPIYIKYSIINSVFKQFFIPTHNIILTLANRLYHEKDERLEDKK